jgi:hypothetical protein
LARRIIVAVVFALIVVVYVVVRDADRGDARFTIVSEPAGAVAPYPLPPMPVRFNVPSTSVKGPGHLFMQVGTYLESPSDTIILTLFGSRNRRLARCVFPPAKYHDNSQLACPVTDISRVRTVRVGREGTAKVAVLHHEQTAGYLGADEQVSLLGRVSTVLSRIAIPLPNGVGSAVVLFGLFGSTALTAFALLYAVGREEEGPSASTSADDLDSVEGL